MALDILNPLHDQVFLEVPASPRGSISQPGRNGGIDVVGTYPLSFIDFNLPVPDQFCEIFFRNGVTRLQLQCLGEMGGGLPEFFLKN